MSFRLRSAFALLPVALLAACSSLVTGGDLIRPGEATGTITVVNNSQFIIDAVLISECNASTYGLNRMVERETIAIGASRSFGVSAGCWDVAAGSWAIGDVRERMTVAAGGTTTYVVN